ncbi:hypothetical protein [Pseudomonas fluorescens]|uniref:hypothetical protein n=1 Tax=Pseudomonas fluorescens TaxID=294 RepID=UPI001F342D16|nr:hypothetical protein [Pseudomonas fluorescens]
MTLRVTLALVLSLVLPGGTRSVPGGIPTQSVGTIQLCSLELAAVQVGEHVAKVPDLMGLEALLVESGLA